MSAREVLDEIEQRASAATDAEFSRVAIRLVEAEIQRASASGRR